MAAAQILAIGLVAIATMVRVWLGARIPDTLTLALYYPVILAAALVGGWAAGATALGASLLVAWQLFLPSDPTARPGALLSLALYLVSGGFMAFAGARIRSLIGRFQASNARLAESELRYRTLFEAVSEGFALVRAIRDPEGRLVDYEVIDANPAMLRIMNADASMIGKQATEIIGGAPPTWLARCEQALGGEPLTFEYQTTNTRRWYEIHLSRVADDRLAQFVQDVTDRKAAEAHQSEMFDELNHRVKNNLALVSAMLSLQARDGVEPAVRAQLTKAVDRIQAIADVHVSLYRSSRKDDVDFAAYLTDLCNRLAGSLLEEGERVRLQLTADAAVMPLDRAVALGVVVNELVTNAAKYAYPIPAAGLIEVSLRREPAGLVLSVADTGRGLPPDLTGDGIGMRLVRSLVQQIGGVLDVERAPGATFHIRLAPVEAARQTPLF
ncbi:MAG: histidine kinase dimerization/phosphoacceptor domain -containing protein [Phenylobacterium sp.]